MTDRDHFAAAALTGLLAGRKFTALDAAIVAEPYAEAAYGIADAMLRERCRAGTDCPASDNAPNHDAAPAAKAAPSESSVPLGKGHGTGDTEPMPKEKRAEVSFTLTDAEREAVAWIVRTDHFQCGVAEHYETAVRWAEQTAGHIVPLYRQPQPTLTDAEREAVANGIYLCEGVVGEANENVNANAWAKTAGVLRGMLERTK